MPKMKTHKGAARRFRVSGSGKLLRMKRHSSHLRRKKPRSVTRTYSDTVTASAGSRKKVMKLVPGLNK
jgi:large subunit ribosomal protein L35